MNQMKAMFIASEKTRQKQIEQCKHVTKNMLQQVQHVYYTCINMLQKVQFIGHHFLRNINGANGGSPFRNNFLYLEAMKFTALPFDV